MSEKAQSWVETVVVSLFCVWSFFVLTISLGPFRELYEGLGATLPASTRGALLFSNRDVSYSFAAMIVLALVAKEFVVPDGRHRRIINAASFAAIAVLSSLLHAAMAGPMIQLLKNLG